MAKKENDMAGWITHSWIADNLLARGLPFDPKGFYVGNIAPDCNIENEDWTAFTPSREVTHWIDPQKAVLLGSKGKLAADYKRFLECYIQNKNFSSAEERAFYYGYYTHLITDVAFQKFLIEEKRIAAVFQRLKTKEKYRKQLVGYPETFDTLRKLFDRQKRCQEIVYFESAYLQKHPKSGYVQILQKVTEFPDYLDYFPPGAYARKIAIMAITPEKAAFPKEGFLFVSQKEYDGFLQYVEDLLYQKLKYLVAE